MYQIDPIGRTLGGCRMVGKLGWHDKVLASMIGQMLRKLQPYNLLPLKVRCTHAHTSKTSPSNVRQ